MRVKRKKKRRKQKTIERWRGCAGASFVSEIIFREYVPCEKSFATQIPLQLSGDTHLFALGRFAAPANQRSSIHETSQNSGSRFFLAVSAYVDDRSSVIISMRGYKSRHTILLMIICTTSIGSCSGTRIENGSRV